MQGSGLRELGKLVRQRLPEEVPPLGRYQEDMQYRYSEVVTACMQRMGPNRDM